MSLILKKLVVQKVETGDRTGFDQGVLTIETADLATSLLTADSRLSTVSVHLAHPDDSTRVLCVKDVIQPSLKLDNKGYGNGSRLILDNMAVVTTGPIVGFQEGIIDMSGRGALYSPFSSMPLVILELEVVDDLPPHEHEEALRKAGLLASEYLAEKSQDTHVDSTEEILWDEIGMDPSLPNIAYVLMVLSQGLLHDTYVMGQNARQNLPISVDPRVILDAGIISGNCVSACDKNTSFHHCNNPVVRELLNGHGKRWNFTGVVITSQPVRLADKQRSAAAAVAMVTELNTQGSIKGAIKSDINGAIISKEGFGNPDADLVMILRGLEQQGIRTVGITDEFAGADGGSQSIADTTPEADAIVSTGNANEKLLLPPMTTTIGPVPDVARLAGGYAGSLHEDGSLEVELQAIIGATNQLGYGRLSCREI